MMILETTQATFEHDVRGDVPVLVDFWAPWCGPCLDLAPHLEALAADYAGRLRVLKLNVDEGVDTWRRFGVKGIPTLVFFSGGKEHGRLVGPSTMRLHLMVEKWLGELGAPLPVRARLNVGESDSTSQAAQPKAEWKSFGGDASVKAAGLARLRERTEAEADVPSGRLSGDEGEFEAVVGAPESLGDLIDALHLFQSYIDDQSALAQTIEIVEAMPVGADLGEVAVEVMYDLLYSSPWEVTQYFADEVGGSLCKQIKLLHLRERAGECVPSAEWAALQREAVLQTGFGLSADHSLVLEYLAVPLIEEIDPDFVLQSVIDYATTDYRQYPEWSEAEQAHITAMGESDREDVQREMGVQPKVGESGREEWWVEAWKRESARKCARRESEPELWARYDAWREFEAATEKAILAHVGTVLLARLRVVAQ